MTSDSPGLKCSLFGAGDDLILQGFAQVAEVIGVASYAHNQVAVLSRVLPGVLQGGRIYHVELDMVPVQLEVCPHQLDQVHQPGVILQQLRGQLLVEQRAPGTDVIHFGSRPKHSGRAAAVSPLHRRDALAQRHKGAAAVRSGAGNRTKIDVHRRRQHVDMVFAALGVLAPVHGMEIGIEDTHHDLVGSIIIIAILRRAVDQYLAQFFLVC